MGEKKRIRERLAAMPDVRPSDVELFILDMREGKFSGESELEAYVEKLRAAGSPRFINQGDEGLAHQAFVLGNLSARAKLSRQLGPEEFNQVAQRYGLKDGLDFSRKGVAPPKLDKDGKPEPVDAKNPWAPHPDNLDPKTGRYSSNAITRQASIVKTDLGMANRLAAKHGARIGDVRPMRRAS